MTRLARDGLHLLPPEGPSYYMEGDKKRKETKRVGDGPEDD